MRNLTCDHCHQSIPTGEAVIRSRSLTRVAYHRDCATVEGIWSATMEDVIRRTVALGR